MVELNSVTVETKCTIPCVSILRRAVLLSLLSSMDECENKGLASNRFFEFLFLFLWYFFFIEIFFVVLKC